MSARRGTPPVARAPRRRARIYAIGLDPLLYRAIGLDHPWCDLHRRRVLRPRQLWRLGPRPALVLLGARAVQAEVERRIIWRSWGSDVPVVGFDARSPRAYIWHRPGFVQMIDVGPGFLDPFLPAAPSGEGPPVRPSIARAPPGRRRSYGVAQVTARVPPW